MHVHQVPRRQRQFIQISMGGTRLVDTDLTVQSQGHSGFLAQGTPATASPSKRSNRLEMVCSPSWWTTMSTTSLARYLSGDAVGSGPPTMTGQPNAEPARQLQGSVGVVSSAEMPTMSGFSSCETPVECGFVLFECGIKNSDVMTTASRT